ncbi:lipopolysaccharide-induced TNF-alpha factor-like [Planoprotostelium fungivorum]|uniref:Lipopolysaccharide-induced TNF-alpha factor-like n=1 Tax=Planoprotostelium fungivorum TaxID=1890364 RepID=A0A2P6N3K3_9EUKA|nr:lipopolysaccharide-induced TNF-alpha factor-like [Planoprotostelium fungivorum]
MQSDHPSAFNKDTQPLLHTPPQPQYAYHPEQPTEQPGYPAVAPTAIYATPFAGPPHWGEFLFRPQRHVCQYCQANIVTHVHYETGNLTYLAAALTCLFGCFCGCCLIPFYVDSMKDPVHLCPNCHCVVGRKNRM